MKINIIYWSGTGNTQMMAEAIAQGAEEAGAEVAVIPVSEADPSKIDADVVILGCPAMGAENLEESEFQPFYDSVRDKLAGKKLALFGSYDWGDGEWMRTWAADCEDAGCSLVCEPVIACGAPEGDAADACRELGKALAAV